MVFLSGSMRFTRYSLLLSVLIVGCSAGFLAYARRQSGAGEVQRGRGTKLTTGDATLQLGTPIYKQWDSRWAGDVMAPSTATLKDYGCLVSCVAMLYTHYGIETTPKQLNSYLSSNAGFTRTGLLKWTPCAGYAPGRVRIEYIGGPDLGRLEREIARDNPVIVKVKLPGGVYHWVLVTGKREGEFMVADPLGPEKTPVKLSRFGKFIYAMRIFRKAGD